MSVQFIDPELEVPNDEEYILTSRTIVQEDSEQYRNMHWEARIANQEYIQRFAS